MSKTSARELWTAVLGSLQLEVTRHNYETWLKQTVGLAHTENHFTVGVPSPFVAEGLQKRLSPVIHKTLGSLLKQDVKVSYQVYQPWASGLAEAPPPGNEVPHSPETRARLLLREEQLNPKYTFTTFVVGKSNRFAHAAAMAVAENPGRSYNPLFIHAGVGLGKTHLLHAVGHVAQAHDLQVLYVSAEQFTNDFVSALRENRAEEFRNKYRTIDLLLIDDIQFIAGKEHSKESFFHTFNDLHTANKQVVITSDSRPKSIPLLEERLSSRFEGGLIADIQPPDLETRLAILSVKAEQAKVSVPPPVADFIARKVMGNVRELEGALNRLIALAELIDRPIDQDLAQQAVAEIPSAPPRRRHFSPSIVLIATADFYSLSPDLLTSKTRKKNIAWARQVAAYLLREETQCSLVEVGKLLGERGHTTILRAHDKIAHTLNLNSELRHQIAEIRSTLEQRHERSA